MSLHRLQAGRMSLRPADSSWQFLQRCAEFSTKASGDRHCAARCSFVGLFAQSVMITESWTLCDATVARSLCVERPTNTGYTSFPFGEVYTEVRDRPASPMLWIAARSTRHLFRRKSSHSSIVFLYSNMDLPTLECMASTLYAEMLRTCYCYTHVAPIQSPSPSLIQGMTP